MSNILGKFADQGIMRQTQYKDSNQGDRAIFSSHAPTASDSSVPKNELKSRRTLRNKMALNPNIRASLQSSTISVQDSMRMTVNSIEAFSSPRAVNLEVNTAFPKLR